MVFTYVRSGRSLALRYPKMRCHLTANHFTMPNLPPEPWTRLSFSRNRLLHYFGVDLQLICIRLQRYPSKTTTDQPINRHGDPQAMAGDKASPQSPPNHSVTHRPPSLHVGNLTTHASRKAGGDKALLCSRFKLQLNTIVAALADLMLIYDHNAGLVAELYGRVKESNC